MRPNSDVKNMKTEFSSFAQMLEVINSDYACRMFLENVRWGKEPICPHCGVQNKEHYKLKSKGEFKGQYKCKDCRERFTVTVGTMFEGSHISLRKWFIAIYIFSSHKKGISSHQLSRDLGITQKSAWFMLGRLRHSFQTKTKVIFSGTVSADETYIGGKTRNKHINKRAEGTTGRSLKDKTPVFGLMNNNIVKTIVVPDTKAKTLKPIIAEIVETGATLVTDEYVAYCGLEDKYKREVVHHNAGNYLTENGNHTNSLEGFWALLKRGIYGIYHQVSAKHLNQYLDEFTYRYNTRESKDSDRFNSALLNADERLSYKALIGKA